MTKKAFRHKLIVIAGPNGAGKTTFTNQVLRHDWSEGCVFINPDEIARNDFGDWNSPDAVMKAVVRAKDGQVFKTYADLKLHEWGQMMIEELAKPA